MTSMIKKNEKNSESKPQILIIITNPLQKSYLKWQKTFEVEFSGDFAMKWAFFKVTNDTIQTIDGLVSVADPQCLVFFLVGFPVIDVIG